MDKDIKDGRVQIPNKRNIDNSEFIGNPKSCQRCGRIFNYSGFGHLYCPACKKIDDDAFQKVKDYIFENGVATALEVSEATDISMRHIERYLREGRLEIPEGSPIYIKCEKCGADIRSGRFCQECATRMSAELRMALDFDDYQVGDKPKAKKQDGKMRFLSRDE